MVVMYSCVGNDGIGGSDGGTESVKEIVTCERMT